MTGDEQPGLLPADALLGARKQVARARAQQEAGSTTRKQQAEPAATDPVAAVLVDLPLAHLDRAFDYLVPAAMAQAAVPGARVKVRFAGQDVDGYLVARRERSEHGGRLQPLRRVVSSEPVLTPSVQRLVAEIAERYAGTRADVLRLAVPPRHAGAEKQEPPASSPDFAWDAAAAAGAAAVAWTGHQNAEAFLSHLTQGDAPRAVWTAAPASDWAPPLAYAVAATVAAGKGAVICVPDHRDVARLDAALTTILGTEHHVVLHAEAGPARRYRDFLAVSRGHRQVVIGTRAAAFAPVADLGLVAMWDDGDDLFAEPRAPYPHAREVLLTRAVLEETAVLLGSHARSVEAQQLVLTGWARELVPTRDVVRERVQVSVASADDASVGRDAFARSARVPHDVHQAIRRALTEEPVLVQTPRAGYAPALACERCRTPARCGECRGPLRLVSPTEPPSCRWCGRVESAWACPECGHRGLRAPVLGDRRTAEELGRAFAPTKVIASNADKVLPSVPAQPALVVATPGAEPVAEQGYGLVVLLDTWLALARPEMRVGEEALRRWFAAGALVRPGGRVIAVGEPAGPELQALVRWDPVGYAVREADARREARLPPAARVATLIGESEAVQGALEIAALPDPCDVLGPVPHVSSPGGKVAQGDATADEVRVVLRVPRRLGVELAHALGEMQRLRSARKMAAVRVQVDPPTL